MATELLIKYCAGDFENVGVPYPLLVASEEGTLWKMCNFTLIRSTA